MNERRSHYSSRCARSPFSFPGNRESTFAKCFTRAHTRALACCSIYLTLCIVRYAAIFRNIIFSNIICTHYPVEIRL